MLGRSCIGNFTDYIPAKFHGAAKIPVWRLFFKIQE